MTAGSLQVRRCAACTLLVHCALAVFTAPAAIAQAPPAAQNATSFAALRNTRTDRLQPALAELFGNRLVPITSGPSSLGAYRLAARDGSAALMVLDPQRSGVEIQGPQHVVGPMQSLVAALDSPPLEQGRTVRIVPLRTADWYTIRRATRAYLGQFERAVADARAGGANGAGAKGGPLSLIGQLFQQENAAPAEGPALTQNGATAAGQIEAPPPAPPDAPLTDREIEAAQERLGELGADVEVEALPDLDVLILRGDQRDVDELVRIIREIERLSAETKPVIEVYQLRHVSNQRLGVLATTVSAALTGPLHGRVTVTPLVEPNALLLIGWGEAVASAKELIAQLDQPMAPGTLVKVFPLRHAPAQAAATTLTTFFAERQGLAPQVLVTAEPRTNSLIVQAAPRDMAEAEMLIARIDAERAAAINRVRVFRLRNTLAADLASALSAAITGQGGPGAPPAAERRRAALELLTIDAEGEKLIESGILHDVQITPDPRTNSLIVSSPPENMDLVAALIQQLDENPTAVAQIKVFRIVNSDATSMIQMLRSLLPSATGNGPPGPQLPGSEGESSLVPLRFSVDVRTNSIIATGSAGDLRIIEALLLRLDEKDVKQRQNEVYRLKNAPAAAVAQAINDFLRSERVVQQAAPGEESPFLQIEREVVVVPERVSNSLIISATPRFFKEIHDLVERLDAQPPQVMIQVIIAEVALSDTRELGVEFGLQDSVLFDRSLISELVTQNTTRTVSDANGIVTTQSQRIVGSKNEPGFNFNNILPLGNSGSDRALGSASRVGGQGLSNFDVGRVNSELGFGGLVLSASSESISVLLRALQECRRLEILSRPQVMTLDNQSAFIQVGQRVPRIVSTQINQIGQVNELALENVGLILGVTPRISPDGMVVMEVDAEKSEVGPEAEGIPVSISATGEVIRSPRIDITTAQTTVSAANGQTIVLGGLITKRMSTTDRRVPFLGDVPILGWLFRYDADQTRRTELLIVLTPRVVLGPEDAERIKEVESARMSWTCSAVHNLHGPGLCNDRNCEVCQSEAPVIYPDLNPRGIEIEKLDEYIVPGSEQEMPASIPEMQSTPGTEIIPQGPVLVPPQELPLPADPGASGGPSLPLGRARPPLIPANPARMRAREPAAASAITPAAYNHPPVGAGGRPLPIVQPRQLPSRPATQGAQYPAAAPPVAVSRLPTNDVYVR